MPIGASENQGKTNPDHDELLGVVPMDPNSKGEGGAGTPSSNGSEETVEVPYPPIVPTKPTA